MAKVVGFNKEVADRHHVKKEQQQQALSLKQVGASIHFVKSFVLNNPVLKKH